MKSFILSFIILILFSCTCFSQTADDLNKQGIEKHSERKYEEAIVLFTKAIEMNPELCSAYYNRGNTYFAGLFNKQKAIEDFSKVIEIDPKDAEALYMRAIAYYLLGEYEKAIPDLKSVQEIMPNSLGAFFSLGLNYYELKDYMNAILNYTKYLEISLSDAQVFYNRGKSYLCLQDTAKACEDWKMAVLLDSELAEDVAEIICK